MPKIIEGPKVHNTFLQWLLAQRGEQTALGDLARDAFADIEWDGSLSNLKLRIKESHLIPHQNTEKSLELFDKARRLYQNQRRKY